MQTRMAQQMCEEIQRIFPLSPKVREALIAVDREIFVPSALKHLAYSLDALPMVDSQWISSPLTVAKMSEYLAPNGGDSVLEVGCGSGYQAMIFSKMFRRVFSIERIGKLLNEAKERFRLLQAHNIFTKLADGQKGWEEYAPFDAILFSACAKSIPHTLVEQLSEGGVIVVPLLEGNKQVIKRFVKSRGQLDRGENLSECLFVDIQDGILQ